jgi:transposase InsO family protein
LPRLDVSQETSDEATLPEAVRHARAIGAMSSREAKRIYGVGFRTWQRCRDGELEAWVPSRGGRSLAQDTVDRILASVAQTPQLNTVDRAAQLRIRTETVQKVLARHGLSRLTARLVHAGFKVDVVQPLATARKRRLLATSPGALTCIDYKAFGVVRGSGGSPSIKICGCVVVDHLTAYGTVKLSPLEDAIGAREALAYHLKRIPFACTGGILLSDNGACFTSDEFMEECARAHMQQRTTRYNHPWSNGKVEALNKTLKQQCFPAICSGVVHSLDDLQVLVDTWMWHYNHERAHSSWINKGLPPHVFWEHWRDTPGKPLDKLATLGLVRERDLPYTRVMGTNLTGEQILSQPFRTDHRVPPVLIIDYNLKEAQDGKQFSRFVPFKQRYSDPGKNVTLAK